tara:strand:+ start:1163 stop:2404 length:1242 start_codon:yes stop_codon:yes gene_type:complete
MNDLLPEQTCRWQKIESLFRAHFQRAGLKEIRTPLLEVTELFSRAIGEETDVVGKEMYTFLDRSQRSCTLRPEGTASVVRSLIQHGLINKSPLRLWYSGPMFRYERPQAGRMRQFHQVGVEFFGLPSVISDAELISIAWDFLNEINLKGLKLELNSLGNIDDRKVYKEKIVSWLEDKFDLLDEDSQRRLTSNPLRILDSKVPSTKELLLEVPLLINSLCNESRVRFEKLQDILNNLEIPFELNSRLVRGLDYYSHTAFEITSTKLGAQATICGGGRYDSLVNQLGGIETSSIGWAIGLERLLLLLDKDRFSLDYPDVYLINKGEKSELFALTIARKLRSRGIVVEIDTSGSSFSKQFKRADRSNSKWAIILGEDEIANRQMKLKCLNAKAPDSNENLNISLSEVEKLISILKS